MSNVVTDTMCCPIYSNPHSNANSDPNQKRRFSSPSSSISAHVVQQQPPPQQQLLVCANCGGYGHGYKNCNHPIISYGIICYRFCYEPETNSISPRYLMVQRKDSLCYVEFIRGKYDLQNKDYLFKLFSNMTETERQKIATQNFEVLWNEMWCRRDGDASECTRNFNRELKESQEKFNMLKKGFFIKPLDTDDLVFFNIDYILENTLSLYDNPEWGFPKGRRNMSENDLACALREFTEETGISSKQIKICVDIKPIEEVFSGSNRIRYKHVYYVGKQHSTSNDAINLSASNLYNPENKIQSKEIKDVRWFSYQEAQQLIRNHNVERKELFKRLNNVIMRTVQ